MKQMITFAACLLGVLAITGCSGGSKRQDREDSIKTAQALLDSIRQDSIQRVTFSTPDLAFNDLHGDVRECVMVEKFEYWSDDKNDYCWGDDTNEYKYLYDEEGNWTNLPEWQPDEKEYAPERTRKPKVERDKDGRICRINDCEGEVLVTNVKWENEKVKEVGEVTRSYDESGLPLQTIEIADCVDSKTTETYCNYQVDALGNWVKRDVLVKFTDWDGNNPKYSKRLQTRRITYFKSDGGDPKPYPNSAEMQKAVSENEKGHSDQKKRHREEVEKEQREREQREREQRTNWIYGEWSYRGYLDYGPYMGGVQRVTADVSVARDQIVVIMNGKISYVGPFTVDDENIRYNQKNGCCDVLGLDQRNHRLEFGKGEYFKKVR